MVLKPRLVCPGSPSRTRREVPVLVLIGAMVPCCVIRDKSFIDDECFDEEAVLDFHKIIKHYWESLSPEN